MGLGGLAYSLAGSEENFVNWMNDKALELGLDGLHFANVIGLDDVNNYGTVNEVASLLKIALENDTFKEIFEAKEYTLTNGMVIKSSMRDAAKTYDLDIDYILGGKTGYTNNAGKCLASIAYDSVNDINYMLVTTGASTSKTNAYHVLDATKIYTYYFENYKYYTLVNSNDIIKTLDTIYSKDIVNIILDKDIKYYTNEVDESLIEINYDGVNSVKAGTKVGTKLGNVKISYDGTYIDSVDIYLNSVVSFSLIEFIKTNILVFILGIIIFLIIILLLIRKNIQRKLKEEIA